MRRGLAAAVVGVIALAGCGSANSTTAVLTEAPIRTATAKTAKVSQQIHLAFDGTQQLAVPPDIQGEGAFNFGTRQCEFTVHVGKLSLLTLMDGQTLYERLPATNSIFGGKSWVKVHLVALGSTIGRKTPGDALPDPFGEPTTHYKGTVDPVKAAINAPDGLEAFTQQLVKMLGTNPIDVWVDGAGRVRRIHMSLAASADDGPLKSLDLTVEFYDFGTPVSLTVPPADQVFDLSHLLSQL